MEINIKNVSYTYDEGTIYEYKALSNINMQLESNQIYGIMGSIGSGKTTLMELLNGILIPTEGTITIGAFVLEKGRKYHDMNAFRKKVGLVFQVPEEQFFGETVKEELEVALRAFQYKTSLIDKRVIDVLKMVGLDESYLSRNPFSLSNGEKRRVAIASILIFNPDILILDEPTVGLDDFSVKMISKMLRMLKTKYHKMVIVVSHNANFLHSLVDYVYILNKGSIVLEGKKYDVFKRGKDLANYGLENPSIMRFVNMVLEKKLVKLRYRDDINDLIKDIYRYVK